MKQTIIRKAKKSDIKAISTIEKEAYSDTVYESFLLTKQDLKQQRKDKDMVMLVAERNGSITGYILIDIAQEDPSAANIDSLAVGSDYVGQGIENLLLATAEQVAVEEGFDAITIQSAYEDNIALKTLRRIGYQKTKHLGQYFNNHAGIELEKTLVTKAEQTPGNVVVRKNVQAF